MSEMGEGQPQREETEVLAEDFAAIIRKLPLDKAEVIDTGIPEEETWLLHESDAAEIYYNPNSKDYTVLAEIPDEISDAVYIDAEKIRHGRAMFNISDDEARMSYDENQLVLGRPGFGLGTTEFTFNKDGGFVTKREGQPLHDPLTEEDKKYFKEVTKIVESDLQPKKTPEE
jgi:hypothetical protein